MLSPFMTVAVLVVLWLIVVVPMIVRRGDERRRERSVDGFGRAMRALGSRAGTLDAPAGADVFVPRNERAPLAAPARRPVPAAQEALMYPPDRSDLSEARTQMLTRRRRSLSVLIGGTVLFAMLGLVVGGLTWVLFALFAASLGGYMWFLRNQALRDRARREHRQERAVSRRTSGYDATPEYAEFETESDSVVRIDDDAIELHSMDTIDLTGLYAEEREAQTLQRRAS